MPLRRKEKVICLFCLLKLPKTGFKYQTENPIEQLFRGRVSIEGANSFMYFTKSGLAQRLMHDIKYGGNQALGIQLGKFFGEALLEDPGFIKPDVLIAVPLHPTKLKKRGYNQSELIALGLSERLGIAYRTDILVRARHTDTQTRKKRYERWENMKDGFMVTGDASLRGKRLAIVDDVVTTGATLEACSEILIEELSVAVDLLTLCVAIR